MIDWDNLRVFLGAVRAGNYTAAAKRLHIDRTTVGRRLDRLEQQLGAPIFEQGEDGYHPTPAGRRALEIADAMEQLVEGLVDEIADRPRAHSGQLRVIVAAELGSELMPEFAAFANANPDIRLSIQSSPDPAEHVIQRKSDIGLCLVERRPEHLRGRRIGTLHQAPYASIRYLDRKGRGLASSKYDWIRCLGGSQQPVMRRWSQGFSADIPVSTIVDSWPGLRSAVDQDIGAAFLWTFIADRSPHLEALPPLDGDLGIDLWLLVRDDVPMDRPTRTFLNDLSYRLATRLGQVPVSQ